jgi:hypothetical protein
MHREAGLIEALCSDRVEADSNSVRSKPYLGNETGFGDYLDGWEASLDDCKLDEVRALFL